MVLVATHACMHKCGRNSIPIWKKNKIQHWKWTTIGPVLRVKERKV